MKILTVLFGAMVVGYDGIWWHFIKMQKSSVKHIINRLWPYLESIQRQGIPGRDPSFAFGYQHWVATWTFSPRFRDEVRRGSLGSSMGRVCLSYCNRNLQADGTSKVNCLPKQEKQLEATIFFVWLFGPGRFGRWLWFTCDLYLP